MSNLIHMFWDQEKIFDQIAENDGEMTPEIEAHLNQMAVEIPKKVDNIGFFVVMREKEVESLKIMEKSIYAKRKSIEKSIDRLKSWLAYPARQFGEDGKLKGAVVTIKDISCEKVEVMKEDEVPFDCLDMVVTMRIPYHTYQGLVKDPLFQQYTTKAEPKVNTDLITETTPGCKKNLIKNVSFLGLKKLEVKAVEN